MKTAAYYDKLFSENPDMSRYNAIYSKVGEWTKQNSVLDIGCGTGSLVNYIKGPYHGFDFSPKAVELTRNRKRIAVWLGDVHDESNYHRFEVDTYIALEVLEHVDDLKVLQNIPYARNVIFSVPSFGDPAHLRTYTEISMHARFEKMLDVKEVVTFYQGGDENVWLERVKPGNYILLVRSVRLPN